MASTNLNNAINRIETAVDSQAELLAQLSSVLDGKAGGGSGSDISTCTVTISESGFLSSKYIYAVIVNELIDGVISGRNSYLCGSSDGEYLDNILPLTFDNVVCGSYICILTDAPDIYGYSCDSGIEYLRSYPGGMMRLWCFHVTPEAAGKSLNIVIRDDD